MPGTQADDAAARAAQRDLVRRGCDAISLAYRGDSSQVAANSSAEDVSRYVRWVAELADLLPARPPRLCSRPAAVLAFSSPPRSKTHLHRRMCSSR
jgi:hypothetical protein